MPKRKTRKRINNIVDPKKTVSNSTIPERSSTLVFDFSYQDWLRSIRHNNFTNKLKNDAQFANYIFEVLYNVLPTIQKNWNVIRTNQQRQFPHCHTLSKDKIKEVEEVIERIHGKSLLDIDTGDEGPLNYWQLGLTQSVRLIALYNNYKNVMYPLFIDYHHLIHPSIKHNQRDYDNYSFCPYCVFAAGVPANR